jgi:NAD-dependent DNA ligase
VTASAARQIERLREQIRHHDRKYYVEAAPEISDSHARPIRDGLRSLQLRFREISTIPDAPGPGPGQTK